MNKVLRVGIVLGLLVAAWQFVMGFTGWYKHPLLMMAFFLWIPIQVGVLIWGLQLTARDGKRYWPQVGAGTLMSAVAGVILIVSSLIFTTVAFPEYFEELQSAQREMLAATGLPQAEIDAQLERAAASASPAMQAIYGFLVTLVMGLIASLVIAIFVRQR